MKRLRQLTVSIGHRSMRNVCVMGLAVYAIATALADVPALDRGFTASLTSRLSPPGKFLVEPDGHVLVGDACTLNGRAVASVIRLNSDGTLDTAFGGYTPPDGATIAAIARRSNGNIVLSLLHTTGLATTGLLELLPDGTIKPTFVASSFPGGPWQIMPFGGNRLLVWNSFRHTATVLSDSGAPDPGWVDAYPSGVLSAAADASGRLLVLFPSQPVELRRYAADGTRDAAFAPSVSFSTQSGVAVEANGKILVWNGTVTRLNEDGTVNAALPAPYASGDGVVMPLPDGRLVTTTPNNLGPVVVYLADGTVDPLFRVPLAATPTTYTFVGELPGPRYLLVEAANQPTPSLQVGQIYSVVCRLADGTVDPTFGAALAYRGYIQQMVPDGAGGVVIAGPFDHFNGQPRDSLAHLVADGTLDPVFVPRQRPDTIGQGVLQPLPNGEGYLVAEQVGARVLTVPARGRYVRIGNDGELLPWQPDLTLLIGAVTPGVERDGSVIMPILQPENSATRCSLRRYSAAYPQGQDLATTIEIGTLPPAPGFASVIRAIPLQDGTIGLSGSFVRVNGELRSGAARLNADGTLTSPAVPLGKPVVELPFADFKGIGDYAEGVLRTRLVHFLGDGQEDPNFVTPHSLAAWSGFVTSVDTRGRYLFSYGQTVLRLLPDGGFDANVALPAAAPPFPVTVGDGIIYLVDATGSLVRYVPSNPMVVTQSPQDTAVFSGRMLRLTAAVGDDAATYQWYHDGVPVAGGTNASLTIAHADLSDAGQYWVVARDGNVTLTTSTAAVTVPRANATLANFSARAVATANPGDQVAGWSLSAPGSAVVRAVGPSLRRFGVTNALPLPLLQVWNAGGALTATNAGWGGLESLRQAFVRVGAFPLADPGDAALDVNFDAGLYTAQVTGPQSGVALFEWYRDGFSSPDALRNASLRCRTATGENTPVLGFVVTGATPATLLVRVVAGSLATFGITDVAQAPTLTLNVAGGGVVTITKAVDPRAPGAARKTGAFPLTAGQADAAAVVTLEPGVYSLTPTAEQNGTVLLEVYLLPE